MSTLRPPNPNDEPAFLSYNNLWTNSCPCYARPLGVGVKEEQTEGSNDIVKCPPISLLNPNDEPAFLSYNNLWTNSRPCYARLLGVGVSEKEQTEGNNGILNYPPTIPRNPNHELLAFCMLLTVN